MSVPYIYNHYRMYCAMRSRKLWVDADKPLHFCCFLSDRLLLLLYQDNQVAVLDTDPPQGHEVCRSVLPSTSLIIECKRISLNTCVALPKEKDILILMRITPQLSMEYRVVPMAAGLENSPLLITQMIVLDGLHFVLVEHDYSNRSLQVVLGKRRDVDQLQIETGQFFQLDWGNHTMEVVRPLQGSLQLAIFTQQRTEWRVMILSVVAPKQEKSIDMQEFFTEGHTLIDVMVAQPNEYLLFAAVRANEERMQVWRCRLHGGQGRFVQSCQMISNYGFTHSMSYILSVNHRMGTFLTLSQDPHYINGEIYDNRLRLVSISSGITLETLSCNLKAFDITPNQQMIVDYSQEVNTLDKIAIHLRVILPKPIIYHSMLHNSPLFTQEKLTPSFQAMILHLL